MNKFITKIATVFLLLAFAVPAHACGGKRSDKWMFWMYDKETTFVYANDFTGEGKFTAGMDENGLKTMSTIERRGGNVTATINVIMPSGQRKTYTLSGKIYAMYKCLGSPGQVRWDQEELQDYDALPPGVRSAIQDYKQQM